MAVFRLELHFTWRKSATYKVSLCEYLQRENCKAFTGLSSRSKMVRGGCSLLRENLTETDPPGNQLQKRRFPVNIRS